MRWEGSCWKELRLVCRLVWLLVRFVSRLVWRLGLRLANYTAECHVFRHEADTIPPRQSGGMTSTRTLEFLGLERLDNLILKLREDIGYVSVEEVLTRNKNDMVGRAEFSVTEIGAFLEPAAGTPDDEPFTLGDLASSPAGPTASSRSGT